MKQLLLVPLLLLVFSCSQPVAKHADVESVFDEATETASIMKTIRDETECFFKRDYKGWKELYVQRDYTFQAWTNADGSIAVHSGWDAVNRNTACYLEQNPVAPGRSNHPWIERRNLVVKFFTPQVAYLAWDQYNSDANSQHFIYSKDQRIMEKINGNWKISNVSSYWDYKHVLPIDSIVNL